MKFVTADFAKAAPSKPYDAVVSALARSLKDPLTKVNEFLLPYKPRIDEVNVDVIGVGHDFVPRLEALGYPCNEVNVGTATQVPDQFANLKTQLYWKLRELFQYGPIHGLNGELAISQLASIKWKANLLGHIRLCEAKGAASASGRERASHGPADAGGAR